MLQKNGLCLCRFLFRLSHIRAGQDRFPFAKPIKSITACAQKSILSLRPKQGADCGKTQYCRANSKSLLPYIISILRRFVNDFSVQQFCRYRHGNDVAFMRHYSEFRRRQFFVGYQIYPLIAPPFRQYAAEKSARTDTLQNRRIQRDGRARIFTFGEQAHQSRCRCSTGSS